MKLDELFFWQNWPVSRRKQYFRLMMLVWRGVWGLAFVMTTYLTDGAKSALGSAQQRYEKIVPLIQEIKSLEARQSSLTDMTPLAAAQQVSRDLKLESKLASIRPTQLTGNQEGVQLLYERLNLDEFLSLLDTLQDKGRLKIISTVLNHRGDQANLADLQLVLAR